YASCQRYETHWPTDHSTVATARSTELTTRISRSRDGVFAIAASARNAGKRVRQKRGIESNGKPGVGALSGIARLPRTNRPYGAPKRRQATTPSQTKTARKAKSSRLCAATCRGSAPAWVQ